MTRRIFRSICAVALAALVLCIGVSVGALYGYFSSLQRGQLRELTELVAGGTAGEGEAYLQGLNLQRYRVTWIAANGQVRFDNQNDPAGMTNHLERDEVKKALESGWGESVRYSNTALERLLYAAQRLPDGSVVRLSCAQSSIMGLALGMLPVLLALGAGIAALALLLARRLAKRIVEPLNRLDLDNPLANQDYDELSPLLRRIYSQQRRIGEQTAELHQKKKEFDAVADSMNEGLALLNPKGQILSINQAGAALLETERECGGREMLALNRTPQMRELLQKARQGSRAEIVLPLAGGRYQIDASPIATPEGEFGAALLIFDVTQREKAEQIRREFTANVSHELKTPLHSISGCAELLTEGMVKPEDISAFAGQIYHEAQRMTRLVEDILRLAKLDEGEEETGWESVDLYELVREVAAGLKPDAEKRHIALTVSGERTLINGVPPLLRAVANNLCDNALRYNREGGSVTVKVSGGEKGATLEVSDTGIGIAPQHQERVFERFYRVDKSHSREVGGTGLGLSIVKHAVRLHHGQIQVVSQVGQGTTMTVRFPAATAGMARKALPDGIASPPEGL